MFIAILSNFCPKVIGVARRQRLGEGKVEGVWKREFPNEIPGQKREKC